MQHPGHLITGWMSGEEIVPLLELGDLVEFHRDGSVPYQVRVPYFNWDNIFCTMYIIILLLVYRITLALGSLLRYGRGSQNVVSLFQRRI